VLFRERIGNHHLIKRFLVPFRERIQNHHLRLSLLLIMRRFLVLFRSGLLFRQFSVVAQARVILELANVKNANNFIPSTVDC
jgi:hypothetical protein